MAKKRWSAVVKRETGEPVSFCTAGKEAPKAVLEAKGLEVVDLGEHDEPGPDFAKLRFDRDTRRLVARVVKDRLQDLREKPGFDAFWGSLNATQKTQLVAGLKWLLGPLRYRQEDEQPELGPEVPEA
jgi:hypothetical protein